MPKPIFIIGWPVVSSEMIADAADAEYLNAANEREWEKLLKATEPLKDEYYLFIYGKDGGEPVFHAFYDKDFSEAKAEEIEKLIRDLMKKP